MATARKTTPATQTRRTKAAASTKAAKVVEPEDDDELEELEEDEVEEAPAKKGADDVVFGVADICRLLNKSLPKGKKPVTPRELRTLIRKMAREENARVDRVITPGNRTRYSWSGPKDPEVVAIIAAYKGGELEADKAEKLAALKERKAAQKAEAEKAPAKKTATKRRTKAEPVIEEDDEEVEELELDDEE